MLEKSSKIFEKKIITNADFPLKFKNVEDSGWGGGELERLDGNGRVPRVKALKRCFANWNQFLRGPPLT